MSDHLHFVPGMMCAVRSHKVDRAHAWFDGISYRGNCKRCGRPMIRVRREWVPFDSAVHADPAREARPDRQPVAR